MLTRLNVFALGLAIASPAASQTSDQSAAARAEGDRIIAAAEASDVVRNISGDGVILVKHPASGMVCRFDPAASRNNVRVYPVRPGVDDRGDDVGCGTTPDAAFTIYATRYRPAISVETAMTQAVEEIEGVWSDIKRLGIATPAGAEDSGFAVFRGRHPNGQTLSTVVLVRQIGPWTFKMRASGPPDQAEALAQAAVEQFTAQIPQTATASR